MDAHFILCQSCEDRALLPVHSSLTRSSLYGKPQTQTSLDIAFRLTRTRTAYKDTVLLVKRNPAGSDSACEAFVSFAKNTNNFPDPRVRADFKVDSSHSTERCGEGVRVPWEPELAQAHGQGVQILANNNRPGRNDGSIEQAGRKV